MPNKTRSVCDQLIQQWGSHDFIQPFDSNACVCIIVLFWYQSQNPLSLEGTRSNIFGENNEEQSIPSINYGESTWEEDDEWWEAVEREALQLEMNAAIRKLPDWSP